MQCMILVKWKNVNVVLSVPYALFPERMTLRIFSNVPRQPLFSLCVTGNFKHPSAVNADEYTTSANCDQVYNNNNNITREGPHVITSLEIIKLFFDFKHLGVYDNKRNLR